MAKSYQTKKLRITTLFLAFFMALAFCSFFLAACTTQTDKDEDEDKSPVKTDTQTFANGNFEYFDDSNESYLLGTANSWTAASVSNRNGVSSSSSVAKSGIVDTSFEWSKFVAAYDAYNKYKDDEDKTEAEKDENYFTDIDNYYDIPGWDVVSTKLKNEESADDISKAEDFEKHRTAITDAAKALNPGLHNKEEKKDTHVLMLHNYRSDGYGTARQYTSSSITLPAGTAAKVSVWVKTAQLTYGNGRAVDPAKKDRGAFIQINNTVGGTTQDPLVVRNINTANVGEETNGWQQFTFYVKASAYTTSSFTVALGLGRQTEGNDPNVNEYVQGYAFFDDLQYEVMQAKDADAATADLGVNNKFKLDLNTNDNADSKVVNAEGNTTYSLDLDELELFALSSNRYFENADLSGTLEQTRDDYGKTYEDYIGKSNFETDKTKSGKINANKIAETFGADSVIANRFAKFAEGKLGFASANSEIVFLYSSDGAPQTYKLTDAANKLTLGKDQRMIISFWVKTCAMNGGTGATATIVDESEAKTSVGAVDTTTLTYVDLVDDAKKNDKAYKDIYDGWQQCFFFVTNDTDDAISFDLQFSFGPTTLTATKSSYVPGWAAFAGVRYSTESLSDEQFAAKTTGTYAVDVSLKNDTTVSTDKFDETAYTDSKKIETDVADLRNYSGVKGNSSYVGGTDVTTGKNEVKTAGLINKKYADAYFDGGKVNALFPTIADSLNKDNWWNTVFGEDCTQPLIISNTAKQAYGFIANSASTIAADSGYALVSVRVKLSAGATAYVYLIDTTEPEKDSEQKQYADTLDYSSGLSYRYDSDGNVINLDPENDKFNKDVNTIFYKQDNGLWYTAKQFSGDTWYANLQNFADYNKDAKDKDLLNSKDEVVYYAHNGEYYRYFNKDKNEYSVKVKDFTEAGVSEDKLSGAKLQDKVNDKQFVQKIENKTAETSGWNNVRFFIKAGNTAKNYRLEVWSGSRDGKVQNEANSFVIFDTLSDNTLTQEDFNNYSNAALDSYAETVLGSGKTAKDLEKEYAKNPSSFVTDAENGNSLVYFHYSMFDSVDYASYDADRATGSDPYADYSADKYSNKMAFLRHNDAAKGNYETFIDFSASEISVTTATDDGSTDGNSDESAATPTQNVWLLVASIVLAVVLIFTMLALLIRKLLSNMKKKSVHAKPMYDNKRKRYIRKLRIEEAEKDETADDVLPDEYEFTEADIYGLNDDSAKTENESDSDETSSEDDTDNND